MNRTIVVSVAILLTAGCTASTPPSVPSLPVEQSSELKNVTFYLAGMNKELKILGGDGPNKVKQALAELDGVESVEDEWEREIESDEDLDLLFISFRADEITVDQLTKTIEEHGFTAEVKKE